MNVKEKCRDWAAILVMSFLLAVCLGQSAIGEDDVENRPDSGIPRLVKKGTATQLVVDGRPFVMLAGELHNSSASSLEYMQPTWEKLVALKLNTVLATVSWELVEPEEGDFDFSLVDGLIDAARRHDLKLVFLWFGSWKNAVSSYAPPWVKKDLDRFPRVQNRAGRNVDVLTSLGEATCAADAKAFAAFMQHLRKVDGEKHTVLMVQVQNEAGLLGESRDHCPLAEEAFGKPVPSGLMDYLREHRDALIPEFRRIWESTGFKTSGTWTEVFGDGADEVFMAWHVGGYIGKIAAAGKAEYPLPMFANAWLIQHDGQKPGGYPSGGPVSKMMDVWRAAAPQIDLLAADIYLSDFKGVCERYVRSGNPLMIPEARPDSMAPAKAIYAIAEHDAICFAPFGIDGVEAGHPLAKAYTLLAELMPLIVEHNGSGTMAGILEVNEDSRTVELGDYKLNVRFKIWNKGDSKGFGLMIALSPDEFLIAGSGFWVDFSPKPGGLPHAEILTVDEVRLKDGKWIYGRRLNGDESGGGSRVVIPVVSLRGEPTVALPESGETPPLPIRPSAFSIQRVKVHSHR
jgi:hypothetical protein